MMEQAWFEELTKYLTPLGENEVVEKILNNDNVQHVLKVVKENDKLVLGAASALTLIYVANKLLPSSSKKKNKKNKKKSKSKRSSSQKTVEVDPITRSSNEIDRINKEFETEYVSQLNEFFALVDKKLETSQAQKVQPKQKKKKQQQKPKASSGFYKDKLNYKYLFFNESLLKLVMRLDSVEIHGHDQLRSRRKDSIKAIQDYCKQLDLYKTKIDILAQRGIEE